MKSGVSVCVSYPVSEHYWEQSASLLLPMLGMDLRSTCRQSLKARHLFWVLWSPGPSHTQNPDALQNQSCDPAFCATVAPQDPELHCLAGTAPNADPPSCFQPALPWFWAPAEHPCLRVAPSAMPGICQCAPELTCIAWAPPAVLSFLVQTSSYQLQKEPWYERIPPPSMLAAGPCAPCCSISRWFGAHIWRPLQLLWSIITCLPGQMFTWNHLTSATRHSCALGEVFQCFLLFS